MTQSADHRKYRVFTRKNLAEIPQIAAMPEPDRVAMQAVAAVLPFRVNNYVIDELIDWSRVPNDPIYQLTFPQPGMLDPRDLSRMVQLVARGAEPAEIDTAARKIQMSLNPHPAGQLEMNVPRVDGNSIAGMQHKYRETVLFFPSPGQTCHAYCTYCFRWAQFVGLDELKFANREADALVDYLRQHPEVTSVLFTGGDPMVMKSRVFRRYVEPLLELEHIRSIRVGTKSLSYWPYRFTTDDDAGDMLRLFEQVADSGKHLAFMAHFSHQRELETDVVREAIRRIQRTGAVIRCQAPLIRHVNDNAESWAEMWRVQAQLGLVPYYMFVERDTGAAKYFEVPLAKALDIFNEAYSQVSGLARTVRGPSMSATPGKVLVDGVATVRGVEVFVLKFLQARNPDWVGRPFFAKFDASATWLDDLQPAFGEKEFFFEEELRSMRRGSNHQLHLVHDEPDARSAQA